MNEIEFDSPPLPFGVGLCGVSWPASGATRMNDGAAPPANDGAESTMDLLQRARLGDAAALESLCGRYLPRMRAWARGRLPGSGHRLQDTDDLVQDALLSTIQRLEFFDPRGEGAFQAYLRQALLNRIRDAARQQSRRPGRDELPEDRIEDHAPSPLEAAIGKQALERYEAGLRRLKDEERESIVARVELGLSYQELAGVLGKASPDAARMCVSRALCRLAKEMEYEK
jgi:RNA polymerase sigma-70 factor, ECF subfamily